jgi:hypothetical protein
MNSLDKMEDYDRLARLAQAQSKEIAAQKLALACIFRACGFVEDGSNQAVAIFQDDATRDWCFTAGKVNLYASSKSELVCRIVEHYAPNGTLP